MAESSLMFQKARQAASEALNRLQVFELPDLPMITKPGQIVLSLGLLWFSVVFIGTLISPKTFGVTSGQSNQAPNDDIDSDVADSADDKPNKEAEGDKAKGGSREDPDEADEKKPKGDDEDEKKPKEEDDKTEGSQKGEDGGDDSKEESDTSKGKPKRSKRGKGKK